MLKKQIERSVKEFNYKRNPEAIAKLLKWNKDSALISFSGPFCRSCGVYDYFDDFKFELEEQVGQPINISEIDEAEEDFKVTFSVNKGGT